MPRIICFIDDRYRHEPRWLRYLVRYAESNHSVNFLWGAADKVAPIVIYNELAKHVRFKRQKIDSAGHWPMVEQPDEFVENVFSLRRTSESNPSPVQFILRCIFK